MLTYKEWVENDSKHEFEAGARMGLSVSPSETLLSSLLVEYCQDLKIAIYEGEIEMWDLNEIQS